MNKIFAILGFVLLNGVTADDCGGHNTCGSAFSSMSCKGTCCHDDFNAWCCPTSNSKVWKCNSIFNHDSSHCNAPKSCSCTDNKITITSVKAKGEPKVTHSDHAKVTACCASGLSGCGPGTTYKFI